MQSLLRITRSAWRLDRQARAAAFEAFAWVLIANAALGLLPYTKTRQLLTRMACRLRRGQLDVPACRQALDRARHLLPASRCLASGLAAECLLWRHGHAPELTLGVRFDDRGELRAHAWVACGGLPISGGDESVRYAPLARPPAP